MKLNKKGFGVAEMAIVILLIGILAAAVIVGFMGIKKNATEHVKEEATKSLEIIHQTKHAYPTILSKDQKGLKIGEGEYEVYELGGNTIWCDGYYAVRNKGTLYLSGNGTTDDSSFISGRADNKKAYSAQYTALLNEKGCLYVSDLIIYAGESKNKSGYPAVNVWDGEVYLNNVIIESLNCPIQVLKGSVEIDGVNTLVSNSYTPRTGGHLMYIASYYGEAKVHIKGGTFRARNINTWCYSQMGIVTITGGTFIPTTTGPNKFGLAIQGSKAMKAGFYVSDGGVFNIDGGVFQLYNTEPMFAGTDGFITITGGEFKKSISGNAPSTFISGIQEYNADGERISEIKIFDNPNDPNDTSRVIFHYSPTSCGWGQYVAEGYEPYEIEAGKLWGVRPVGTP